MRRALGVLAALALAAVVVIGLTQASKGDGRQSDLPRFDLAAAQRKLEAAPAPLGGLYAQANQLLGGGTGAFRQRLDELKGRPLVINKWASWCGPCQAEFPIFQSVATQRGTQIGFLGLNVNDVDSAAHRFLAKRPLPFPSYVDSGEHLTALLKAPLKVAPVTVMLDRRGRTYIHTGPYRTTAQLNADIDRYLR